MKEVLPPEDYRKGFEVIIANMFSNPSYLEYNFYVHVLAQCKIHFDVNLKSLAGASFSINHYKLWVNPLEFNKISLEHGIGVLKHEMLHILNNHCTTRNHQENHTIWNYAFDIAINQFINKEHLPEGCLYPETFKAPTNKSGEQYYDFLKETAEDQMDSSCDSCSGSGHSHDDCEDCNGSGKNEDGSECESCSGSGKEPCKDCEGSGKKYNTLDNHDKWQESEGNDELRKSITKNMIDKAISKSRGNLPQNIDSMLELFSTASQVSWRKELKNIVGNRKANKTKTIMKPNRRHPNRLDLKGNKKDRTFIALCVVDVSGSMDNSDIMYGLNEINAICKLTNTSMNLIQVDTEVHAVETFDKHTKVLNRKASGGTVMYGAIEYIHENKVPHDVIIFITDSYIEDVSGWEIKPKCRVLWLNTSGEGVTVPGIEHLNNHKQFDLKKG